MELRLCKQYYLFQKYIWFTLQVKMYLKICLSEVLFRIIWSCWHKALLSRIEGGFQQKKSRIRETKHLSTDAENNTDTIVGWTKNTPNPDFFEKRKNNTPFDQRSLIHWEAWFPPCFVGPRISKNLIFLKNRKNHQKRKTQKRLEICQNQRYALWPEVSNPSGSVVSGWTKNTQKPIFFGKRKKSSKTQKLINVQRYAKSTNTPFNQRSLIHQEAWFPPCFVRQNQQKTNFVLCGDFRPLPKKNV